MVLKKQTVWLLTMLSLIVVLSVYYVTTPSGTPTEQATSQSNKAAVDKASGVKANTATSDQFAEYRLQREDALHSQEEQYQAAMTAKDATAVEVSKAQDEIQAITTMESKQKMLEDMIMSKGYGDAVVVAATDSNQVNVYVQADSLSNKQANEIVSMVYDQLGTDNVRVTYEPATKAK